MAREWPFLSTLIDDVEMVLAKADLGIAEAFSELSGELHGKFFPRIRAEFERTREAILQTARAPTACWRTTRAWRCRSACATRTWIR